MRVPHRPGMNHVRPDFQSHGDIGAPAASAKRVASASSVSAEPTRMSVGGKPLQIGIERRHARDPCGPCLPEHKLRRVLRDRLCGSADPRHPWWRALRPTWSDRSTARPATRSREALRRHRADALISATVRPPPALSPPTAMCARRNALAGAGSAMRPAHRRARPGTDVPAPAGKPTASVRIAAARPASVTMRRWLTIEPEQ